MSDYFNAALPEPVRLLGQRLLPLSLGHCILLERLGNPLIAGGVATPDHLFEAVYVCCQKFDEAWESFFADGFQKKILTWQKKIGRHNFAEAIRLFSEYRQLGSIAPELGGDSESKSRTPGAPFLLQLKIALQSRLNYSEFEALNKPLGAAVWEVVALAEMNGESKILNETELEIGVAHREAITKGLS